MPPPGGEGIFTQMNISVLLSLGEQPERNRACLESLARTLPPGWRGEVVLIADHPPENILPLLKCCRVVPAGSPHRPAALQAAIRNLSAPILCFLDADTVFLPGWLPPMLRLLKTAPNAGCVGNVQREPYSGLIDHAGIGFDARGLPVPVGRDLALLPRDRTDRRAAVSMACCLVRRDVFERIGGFDPGFQGPLAGVDFCLRAAEAGYRHYVANRSVVYRYNDAPSFSDDPDLALYLERWGRRARAAHERRDRFRHALPGPSFSAERWELAREARRLVRLEIRDTHVHGWRYLRKHWRRPWRYNLGRVCRALVQALTPPPAPMPPIPGSPADTARPDDGWLFNPPPQP